MNVEQDYIMRMIKEFANVLGRLLFNKKKPMYELDVTNRYHVGDDRIHVYAGWLMKARSMKRKIFSMKKWYLEIWSIWRWRWHFMRI